MDVKKVMEISRVSKLEKWPYPKTFNSLKEAGVESYRTQVSNHELTYNGDGKQWIEKAVSGSNNIVVAEKFDASEISNVIKKHNVEKTSYEHFLHGIASAGCVSYVVNIASREIHYLGSHKGEVHIEKVPQF